MPRATITTANWETGRTPTPASTPEQIDPTDLYNIIAITADQYDSYALSADGSIWDWGYNGYGELGLGNATDYLTLQHLLPPHRICLYLH